MTDAAHEPGPAQASPSADQGPAEEEQDGQGTRRSGALPPAQEPPGDARSSAASPGAGQEFRDAWKAARSAQAKAGRTARGKLAGQAASGQLPARNEPQAAAWRFRVSDFIICPPPERPEPQPELAARAADYLIARSREGHLDRCDVLAMRIVTRRLRDTGEAL